MKRQQKYEHVKGSISGLQLKAQRGGRDFPSFHEDVRNAQSTVKDLSAPSTKSKNWVVDRANNPARRPNIDNTGSN